MKCKKCKGEIEGVHYNGTCISCVKKGNSLFEFLKKGWKGNKK